MKEFIQLTETLIELSINNHNKKLEKYRFSGVHELDCFKKKSYVLATTFFGDINDKIIGLYYRNFSYSATDLRIKFEINWRMIFNPNTITLTEYKPHKKDHEWYRYKNWKNDEGYFLDKATDYKFSIDKFKSNLSDLLLEII